MLCQQFGQFLKKYFGFLANYHAMITDSISSNDSRSLGLNVLVVEDTPAAQKFMAKILESAGYHVVVSDNGLEAIGDYLQAAPDLVVVDLQMPILDGLQTTSILRAIEKGRHTPIIITTARKQNLDRERFIEAGIDAFLPKPFSSAEFLALVENTYRKKNNSMINEEILNKNQDRQEKMSEANETLNISESLERLGGDQELFSDLINFFFEDFPTLLDEIRSSLTRQDWNSAQRAAHSLKGLTANFSAKRAHVALQQIETQCPSQNAEQLRQMLKVAEQEVALLAAALANYHKELKAK
jgi:two-component system sensor histidine kinase/response regulator